MTNPIPPNTPSTPDDDSILDAIDLTQAIGLTAAVKLMRGRGGKHPSIESVRRWANVKRGYYPQGVNGPQLILMTVRINGELLTTPAWVHAFEQARARAGMRQVAPDPRDVPRPTRAREAAQRRANERLDAAGM